MLGVGAPKTVSNETQTPEPPKPTGPRDHWAEYMLNPETVCPYAVPWRITWLWNRNNVKRDVELYRTWHDLKDILVSYYNTKEILEAARADRKIWQTTQQNVVGRVAELTRQLVQTHGAEITAEDIMDDSEMQVIAMEYENAEDHIESTLRQEKMYVGIMSRASAVRLVLQDRLAKVGPVFDAVRVVNEVSEHIQLESTAMKTLEEKLDSVETQSTSLGMMREQLRDSEDMWSKTMGSTSTSTLRSKSQTKFAEIIREALQAARPESVAPQTQKSRKKTVADTVAATRVAAASTPQQTETQEREMLLQPLMGV